MKSMRWRPLLGILTLASVAGAAEMNPKLVPLQPFVGKTWRGVFPNSTPEKPVVDVSRFEVTLNGQVVRNLHSINDGEYGGECLFFWDKERNSLAYHYFTTAGFYTTGTLSVEKGVLTSHEFVKGNAEGIAEVKGASRLLPDGRLHVKTRYLKNGTWVDGREVYYVEDKAAVVRFKD